MFLAPNFRLFHPRKFWIKMLCLKHLRNLDFFKYFSKNDFFLELGVKDIFRKIVLLIPCHFINFIWV